MNFRTGYNNPEMQTLILDRLAKVEFTHTYIFAIRSHGMLLACKVEHADDLLPYITYCEPQAQSHGGVWGVRMWNSDKAFENILEYASEVFTLCSVKEFERSFAEAKANNSFKGNRGDWFETVFTDMVGGERPALRNAKCTETGDIILNGEHLQLKFWNATVTTEPQVNKFYAEYMQREG